MSGGKERLMSDGVRVGVITSPSSLSEKRTRCLFLLSCFVVGSETPSTEPVLTQARPPNHRASSKPDQYWLCTLLMAAVPSTTLNLAFMLFGSMLLARERSSEPITSAILVTAWGPRTARAKVGAKRAHSTLVLEPFTQVFLPTSDFLFRPCIWETVG